MLFDLEREALIASGLRDEDRTSEYMAKLQSLCRPFVSQGDVPPSILTKAKGLFDWLWKSKPTRYRLQGHWRLHNVIDAQISEGNHAVGNCLGLTLLYNCLLRRIGIEAEALYLENAFGIAPHVLTLLRVNDSTIDIDHMLPEGFDYRGHLEYPGRTRWGDRELIADIYHSVGNEQFERGDLPEALENYHEAIRLNPGYERAQLNKTILMDRLRTEEKG
ncbi:MAG: tetratricopeptide repeat protein [Pseudomonadota bacterium]